MYQQFTLAQMRTLAYDRLGGNTSFWRSDEIDRYIRESLKIWNVMTAYWRTRVDMGLTVALRTWYTLPSTISYPLRVEINQVTLGDSSQWDLDYGQPSWQSETGIPQMWAKGGFNLIALWPASATGGESFIVDCVKPAPQPLLDADFVDMGSEELDQVLSYVEHIAAFKEGGQEFDASKELLKSFLNGASTRNAMLKQSSRFREWMGLGDERKRPIRKQPERVGAR